LKWQLLIFEAKSSTYLGLEGTSPIFIHRPQGWLLGRAVEEINDKCTLIWVIIYNDLVK